MTRRDDGKISLVEFLRSIKYARHEKPAAQNVCPTHFAHFTQSAHSTSLEGADDNQHVRSAN